MSRRRVLIVDGDAKTRSAQATAFTREGWLAIPAADLAQGLGLLETQPNYVVLAPELPDGNGEAILRRIRADGLTIPVVVVTSLTDGNRLGELARLRPEAMLQRPIDPEIVVRLCDSEVGSVSVIGSADGEA